MANRLNPYLSFNGNAREAMAFYKAIFGGELTISTFSEGGMPHDPADKDKIMHAQLVGPNGYWLMGSDNPPGMPFTPGNTMTTMRCCAATGSSCRMARPSGCRSRRRRGATASAC